MERFCIVEHRAIFLNLQQVQTMRVFSMFMNGSRRNSKQSTNESEDSQSDTGRREEEDGGGGWER